jgi:ribosomal-protein-alanine N-acetyltransferase
MRVETPIALARPGDARAIALLSRAAIESGLSWRWTPPRVLRSLADAHTNVIVARTAGAPAALAGFAIMKYGETEAHLLLLAVQPAQRRLGIGRALVDWLEATALTAGTGVIRLETRAGNAAARSFYRSLGYVEIGLLRRHYDGVEDAVRIAKDLHAVA